jgi:hypothetical protein
MPAHALSTVMEIISESVGLPKDAAKDRMAFVPDFVRALAGRVLVVDEFVEVFSLNNVMSLWEELFYTNKVPVIFLQVAHPGIQEWIPQQLSSALHQTIRHVRFGMAVPEATQRWMEAKMSGAHRRTPYQYSNEDEKHKAELIKAAWLPTAGHFHDFFGGNLRAVADTFSRLFSAIDFDRAEAVATFEDAVRRVAQAVSSGGPMAIEQEKIFQNAVLGEDFLDKWSGQSDLDYRDNYRKPRREHKIAERIQLMLRIGRYGIPVPDLEGWGEREQAYLREMLEYGILRREGDRLVFIPVVREMYLPYYARYFDGP